MKKTILIDLDGVLNEYKGNYDENCIPKIRDGAYKFIKLLSQKFEVKIFTTRNTNVVQKWIEKSNITEFISSVTNIKEPAYLIIDDRCLKFDGDYTKTFNEIENFKVWYN